MVFTISGSPAKELLRENSSEDECDNKDVNKDEISKCDIVMRNDGCDKSATKWDKEERPNIQSTSTINRQMSSQPIPVCQSCQHLYKGHSSVVLTPSTLSHYHHPKTKEEEGKNTAALSVSLRKDETRYVNLCTCATPCRCEENKTLRPGQWQTLGENSHKSAPWWWPRLKKTLLILAALLPWIGLAVYLYFAYRN